MAIDSQILESRTWLDQFQSTRRSDLNRLENDLADLQGKRAELTEAVDGNHADRESLDALNQCEEEIADLKSAIAKLRDETELTVMAKRLELDAFIRGRVDAVRDEVAAKQGERERIRAELLPTMELQREALADRTRQLDTQVLQLAEIIRGLEQFKIDFDDPLNG